MLFIQIGREVVPRLVSNRTCKAVIVGIKNEALVVIMKQDKSRELVRVKDIVLTENVYSAEDLSSPSCGFFKVAEAPKKTNDFDRYMVGLRARVAEEVAREKGIRN